MIRIDTDLSYIMNKLNISSQRVSMYAGKSIDEIVEAEAAQGNQQAAKFDLEVLSNSDALQKAFKLADPNNRYEILKNLNESDLEALLPLLETEDLVYGLNFFTKDKLLDLVGDIPKDQLIKYVFELFSPEQVMKLMPEEHLNKFLTSTDLDKSMVMKHLKTLSPEVLAQMLEAATGQKAEGTSQQDLIDQISMLKPDKYKDALISIPEEKKRKFILGMVKEDSKLYEIFDADAYTKVLNSKEKPDLVKAASCIEPDQLIKMMGELPKDLLSIVVTQIDPKEFADILIKNFQDVLAQIAAG